MKTNKHIAMWAGPRSRSTVIARAFEQLEGCIVYDEPLVGAYLSVTGNHWAMNDMKNAINIEKAINYFEMDYNKVIKKLTGDLPNGKYFSFQKIAIDEYTSEFGIDWVKHLTNFILIRKPNEIILSLDRALEKSGIKEARITEEMVGLQALYRIFRQVESITGKTPLVIHSDDVVKNPRQTLQWLCDYLGITFDEKMLRWELNMKNSTLMDWISLAKNPDSEPWYETVRNSQTFLPYEKKEIDLPDKLMPLLEKCMPYYEKLLQHRQVFDWSD